MSSLNSITVQNNYFCMFQRICFVWIMREGNKWSSQRVWKTNIKYFFIMVGTFISCVQAGIYRLREGERKTDIQPRDQCYSPDVDASIWVKLPGHIQLFNCSFMDRLFHSCGVADVFCSCDTLRHPQICFIWTSAWASVRVFVLLLHLCAVVFGICFLPSVSGCLD